MTTIERVAEKIKCIGVGKFDGDEQCQLTEVLYEVCYLGMSHDERIKAAYDDLRGLASAALDAVCEGLVWDGEDPNTLLFNGKKMGNYFATIDNLWGCCLVSDPVFHAFSTKQEAADLLMKKARMWIRGEL